MHIDARIPVRFMPLAPEPGRPDEILLLPHGAREVPSGWLAVVHLPPPAGAAFGHAAGCSCCLPRSAQAAALTRLFQARARGETGFFRAVAAALPEGEAASLRLLLRSDPYLSACYAGVDPEQADDP